MRGTVRNVCVCEPGKAWREVFRNQCNAGTCASVIDGSTVVSLVVAKAADVVVIVLLVAADVVVVGSPSQLPGRFNVKTMLKRANKIFNYLTTCVTIQAESLIFLNFISTVDPSISCRINGRILPEQ